MYEEHFGLKAKPFQLSPDVGFFFPSKEHKRALSFLEYGLSQADGFIVITGDVGTGKTTIVQTLLKSIDPQERQVATIVTTQLQADDLLHIVADRFGLEVKAPSKAVLLRELERFLLQQKREQRQALLIVDEVQNLPPKSVEELRMLSNFQLDGQPLIQVFLIGQQQFRATLLSEDFEQLRQRVIATYHLNPLDEDETRTYIEHRLTLAGWDHNPEFAENAFPGIYEFTDGVPRRVNNLCDRLLLFAFLEDLGAIDAQTVRIVAEEIGSEFLAGSPTEVPTPDPQTEFNSNGDPGPSDGAATEPLDTMARAMFDKANVQQRLAALERAIDGLGLSFKSEVKQLKEEVSSIRVLLEGVLHELHENGDVKQDAQKSA